MGTPLSNIETITAIARACHEINRIYCNSLGDTSQVSWEEAPAWQKESAVNGVMFVIENPESTPESNHENWSADKRRDGWVYGPTKDPVAKTHHCLVPYSDLPIEQKAKDILFQTVVNHMTGRL